MMFELFPDFLLLLVTNFLLVYRPVFIYC